MTYDGNDPAALRSIANRQFTRSMQTLLGICTGIAADNQINDGEIHFLSTWLTEYEDVAKAWPGSIIANRVEHILSDGRITEEERLNLLETLTQVTGNHFLETGSAQAEIIGCAFDSPEIIFTSSTFCFTGEFLAGTRSRCRQITEQLGAATVNSVTKRVTHLVIGTIGSEAWVHESFGHKIAKAMQLKQQEHPIFIVTEKHWVSAIESVINLG